MANRFLLLPLLLTGSAGLFAACSGEEENPPSSPVDPTFTFDIPPPDVVTGWPCPPYDAQDDDEGDQFWGEEAIETTQDMVDDNDLDTLTDCQEAVLGSDPDDPDSDGDGVGDEFEYVERLEPVDTDGDGLFDLVDPDDDGDGIPTIEEDENLDGDPRNDDHDVDGIENYLDDDDDGDTIANVVEDLDADGDPRNDDFDGDGIMNWLDDDDDDDGVPSTCLRSRRT
jgi:hypothetical protein